jgi:hypothetical protein
VINLNVHKCALTSQFLMSKVRKRSGYVIILPIRILSGKPRKLQIRQDPDTEHSTTEYQDRSLDIENGISVPVTTETLESKPRLT